MSTHLYAKKYHTNPSEIQCTDESLSLGFKCSPRRTEGKWKGGRTPSCAGDHTSCLCVVESISRGWLALERLRNSLVSTDSIG